MINQGDKYLMFALLFVIWSNVTKSPQIMGISLMMALFSLVMAVINGKTERIP